MVVILFLILGVPMSWHKAALRPRVTWIDWSICLDTWTLEVPQSKLDDILNLLQTLLKSKKILVKDVQSAVGRLLWLTGAWHCLPPLLIPLYKSLRQIPLSMVGVSPPMLDILVDRVNDDPFWVIPCPLIIMK